LVNTPARKKFCGSGVGCHKVGLAGEHFARVRTVIHKLNNYDACAVSDGGYELKLR
jgi:hypothetical protein